MTAALPAPANQEAEPAGQAVASDFVKSQIVAMRAAGVIAETAATTVVRVMPIALSNNIAESAARRGESRYSSFAARNALEDAVKAAFAPDLLGILIEYGDGTAMLASDDLGHRSPAFPGTFRRLPMTAGRSSGSASSAVGASRPAATSSGTDCGPKTPAAPSHLSVFA